MIYLWQTLPNVFACETPCVLKIIRKLSSPLKIEAIPAAKWPREGEREGRTIRRRDNKHFLALKGERVTTEISE